MVQCQACQAELTEQDLNWGSCPKCGIAVSHAGKGTLITPAHPDDIRASGVTEVEDAPDEATPQEVIDEDPLGAFTVGGVSASTPEALSDSTSSGSTPEALTDVSAEDILGDTNTRMSINTNDLPPQVRHKVTSMMFGEDTELGRSIGESLDLHRDIDEDEPTQRSMYDESTAETNVIEAQDDSGSTWQGVPGKGAESNLHIQDRSVIKDNRDGTARTDYQLIEMIGKGGMGTVWKAKQYSIGRDVAVKMIKPEKALNKESRERFLSEAVVTGDLDHPNIVPIHDLGRFESNELFYSMRRVTGMPWDKILPEKTLEENLDIWMKMSDAIAFAHSRGVIHRDIKPENVMVGEFGEVLVMDWGLALPLPNFRRRSIINAPTASGGSPAYMAPEMIGLRLDRVGPWSDIYLLGATLYEIATDQPPHPGRTVSECISNARDNVIIPFHKTGMRQELVQIALKAMATDPKDRYESVKDMQEAVRLFEERQESIKLADNAEVAKNRGKEFEEYGEFARSVFGFEEAVNRWEGNEAAKAGLDEAKLAYAECALKKNDFDLGISLLQPRNPAHAPMVQKLKEGKQNRDVQSVRIKKQRQLLTGLAALFLIGAFGAIVVVSFQNQQISAKNLALGTSLAETKAAKEAADKERDNAKRSEVNAKNSEAKTITANNQLQIAQTNTEEQRVAAVKARDAARAAEVKAKDEEAKAKIAEKKAKDEEANAKIAETNAKDSEMKAVKARDAANSAEKKAKENERLAIQANFVANLRLAATQIDQNNFSGARLSLAEFDKDAYKDLLEVPGNRRDVNLLASYLTRGGEAVLGDSAFQAVAVSPDGQLFATGTRDGKIQFWNRDGKPAGKKLIIHRDPKAANTGAFSQISGLSFSADGKLLASSAADTVRIWDVTGLNQVAVLKHDDFVQSVHFAPQGDLLATTSLHVASAGADFKKESASVRLWNVQGEQVGEGQGHLESVYASAWSKDGKYLITGGTDGVVVWNRAGNSLKLAARFQQGRGNVNAVAISPTGMVASAGEEKSVMLWSLNAALQAWGRKAEDRQNYPFETLQQHTAAVRSLAFSPAGNMLVSAAEDNTLCVWTVSPPSLKVTLRGHGNSVMDCAFIPGTEQVISASVDATARFWDLSKYTDIDSKELQRIKSDDKGKTINASKAHLDNVRAVALNPAGTRAVTAAAARDRTAALWNTVTGEQMMVFKDGQTSLADKTILFNADKWLLTAGLDQVICLWDVARGVELNRIEVTGAADAVAISPDNRWLATRGGDKELWLWDLPEFVKGTKLTAPVVKLTVDESVVGISFSADSQQVAVATLAPAVVVCDIAKKSTRKKSFTSVEFSGIAFLPNGRKVVTTDSDGEVKVFEVNADGLPVLVKHSEKVERGDGQPLVGMSLSSDGKRLAVIRYPVNGVDPIAQVVIWNLETMEEIRRVAKAESVGTVICISLSADGTQVATASKKTDGTKFVQLWSVDKDEAPQELNLAKQGRDAVLAVQLAADGRVVIAQGDEVSLWQWGKDSATQYYRSQRVLTAAAISADDKVVVTGGLDGSLKVWDADTGLCMVLVVAHGDQVNNVMFSPTDPAALVSSSVDGTARIWTWNDADKTLTLKKTLPHGKSVSRARYSDDGAHIVTGCEDKLVRMWSSQGELEKKPYKNKAAVISVDVNKDGSLVVLADDNLVQLVDFSKEEPVALLEKAISGHGRELTDVRFSGTGEQIDGRPTGLHIVTSSLDGTGKIWDLSPSGAHYVATELLTLGKPGRSSGVSSVAVTHDGSAIVTGHRDGSRLIWRSP